jgi:hypothetical protein
MTTQEVNNLSPVGGSAVGGWGNPSARSSIEEDTAKKLFLKMYEDLVFATPSDRHKAVRMLVAAYDLPEVW